MYFFSSSLFFNAYLFFFLLYWILDGELNTHDHCSVSLVYMASHFFPYTVYHCSFWEHIKLFSNSLSLKVKTYLSFLSYQVTQAMAFKYPSLSLSHCFPPYNLLLHGTFFKLVLDSVALKVKVNQSLILYLCADTEPNLQGTELDRIIRIRLSHKNTLIFFHRDLASSSLQRLRISTMNFLE